MGFFDLFRSKRSSGTALLTSPGKADKAVVAITEDKDRAWGLATSRLVDQLENEKELTTRLKSLSERDVRNSLERLSVEFPSLAGVTSLYNAPAGTYLVPPDDRNRTKSWYFGVPRMAEAFEDIGRRIDRLFRFTNSSVGVLAVGEDWWNSKQLREKGYPTDSGRGNVFHSIALFGNGIFRDPQFLPVGYEGMFFYLKQLSGTFGYKNTICLVRDDLDVLMQHYVENSEGKKYVLTSPRHETSYAAPPDKIVAILEPPTETELDAIDACVVAYAGKLIRQGYFPGKDGKVPDHNIWNGDGMQYLLNAAYGLKRPWRPTLTNSVPSDERPDVNLREVEEVTRVLHVANRLGEVLRDAGLIEA